MARFSLWHRRVPEPLIALALGAVVAVGLVSAAKRVVAYVPSFMTVIGQRFEQRDDWLGCNQRANAELRIRFRDGLPGDPDVVQRTDEFGRRVTVQPAENEYRSFALFAVDSMVYGINVADDETIPSFFAEVIGGKKIKVYNYAVPGWGPGNFLALMTDPRFPPGIAERQGFVIYFFFDCHIDRAAGWPFLTDLHLRPYPRYVPTEDGKLQRAGMYAEGKKSAGDGAKFGRAGPSHFDVFSDGVLWRASDAAHRRLTVRILAQAKAEFEKRFNSQGFFTVFLHEQSRSRPMAASLTELGIHCLDLRGLLDGRCGGEPCIQKIDNTHPTASGNCVVATKLAEELAKFDVLQ